MDTGLSRLIGILIVIVLLVLIVKLVQNDRTPADAVSYHAERVANDVKEAAHDIERRVD